MYSDLLKSTFVQELKIFKSIGMEKNCINDFLWFCFWIIFSCGMKMFHERGETFSILRILILTDEKKISFPVQSTIISYPYNKC